MRSLQTACWLTGQFNWCEREHRSGTSQTRSGDRRGLAAAEAERLHDQVAHAPPLGRREQAWAPARLRQQSLELPALVVLEPAPGVAGITDDDPAGVVDALPVDVAGDAAGAFGESGHAAQSRLPPCRKCGSTRCWLNAARFPSPRARPAPSPPGGGGSPAARRAPNR